MSDVGLFNIKPVWVWKEFDPETYRHLGRRIFDAWGPEGIHLLCIQLGGPKAKWAAQASLPATMEPPLNRYGDMADFVFDSLEQARAWAEAAGERALAQKSKETVAMRSELYRRWRSR